jgi:hypothetical protein
VDGDPDEQADDLLALLLGQSGVQAGTHLSEQVDGRLGQFWGLRGFQGGHAAVQLYLVGGNPVELGVELRIVETTPDVEGQGLLALTLKHVERPGEGDRLGNCDGALGVAFALTVEFVKDVARVSQPAFDVGPDLGLDCVGPDRLTPAAAGEGTPLDHLPRAAVPADLAPALGAAVGEPIDTAADDASEQVAAARVLRDRPVGRQRVLGGVPQGRGDQGFDRCRDHLPVPSSLAGPATVLKLAPVDGVDHEVADPPRPPDALGVLLAVVALHEATVTGVVRGHAAGVELVRDPSTAPAVEPQALVDPADHVRGALVSPQDRGVGLEASRFPGSLNLVAEGHDPAAVLTIAGRGVDAIGCALEEHPFLVLGDHGHDVEHERVRLPLGHADEPDPELAEPATDDRHIDEVAPQPVESIDPELVEAMRLGVTQQAAAVRPVGHLLRARHGLVNVPVDKRDIRLGREPPIKGVPLGLDRRPLALVLGADPLVGRDPSDCRLGRHLGSCPRMPGRTLGSPRTTLSAAAIASRSGDHVRSISRGLARRAFE